MIRKSLFILMLAAGYACADSCCDLKRAAAYTSDSIFHLKNAWTNQAGDRVHVDSLRGQWHVAGMFFSHCASICPRLVSDMKQIEDRLDETLREKSRFVLISLDPERDTPEALSAYAEKMGLSPDRWKLWQGHPRDVRALAAAFGIAYRKLPNGDVSHAAPILLLNPEGEIVMQLKGFSDDRGPLVERLTEALAAP